LIVSNKVSDFIAFVLAVITIGAIGAEVMAHHSSLHDPYHEEINE